MKHGFAALLVLVALLGACAAQPKTVRVTVQAQLPAMSLLPPGAVFELSAADVSRADAPATLLAQVRVPVRGALRAELSLPAAALQPPARVSLRGRVLQGEQLLYVSDTAVFLKPEPAEQSHPLPLRASRGEPDRPPAGAQRLTGTYTYFAEVGGFTDCASGQRLWVVPEADNRTLEAAAAAVRRQPGDAVLARVDGRITERVNMEGPARPALIVDRLVGVEADAACPSAVPEGRSWRLSQLGTQAVGDTRAELLLDAATRRYSGHGGCNRILGSFQRDGAKLRFSAGASTLMACRDGMDTESKFVDALTQVQGWRIESDALRLLDATGRELLRLK
jgi:heat shock protein HslJ/uncharacterized lipoprotein YbaY